MATIHQVYTNSPLRNFTYIIEFDSKAICIDPYYSKQVLDFLQENNLDLTHIINTHEHFDHICGNEELKKATRCKILASVYAEEKIPDVDEFLDEGDKIKLDSNSHLEFISTPGHTFSHLCIKYVENESVKALITGDTLFNAGVGNCGGGSVDKMYETITQKFYSLENSVKIYPGHEYWINNLGFTKDREPDNSYVEETIKKYRNCLENKEYLISTIALEKKVNVFFRLDSKTIIQNLKKEFGEFEITDKQVFFKLRQLRDNW